MTIFRRFMHTGLVLLLFLSPQSIFTATTMGAELQVPTVAGIQGEFINLPVTVDKVERLAGIKLVINYDQNILKFINAEKTPYTLNMMYVVNDKVPGRLVIVMASAKGFTAENAALVKISFELLKDVKKEDKISVQITHAELMGDNLKKIKAQFK